MSTPYEDAEREMRMDIKKMLVLIMAFTKKDTMGEDLVKVWIKKYG